MSTIRIDAIFRNGVLQPLDVKLQLQEGERVSVVIESPEQDVDPVRLATQILDGMTEEEIADFERIALNRSNFFVDRDPGE